MLVTVAVACTAWLAGGGGVAQNMGNEASSSADSAARVQPKVQQSAQKEESTYCDHVARALLLRVYRVVKIEPPALTAEQIAQLEQAFRSAKLAREWEILRYDLEAEMIG